LSSNDRCAEALFALRAGVDLGGGPELAGLREHLDEIFQAGAAGTASPPRELVLAVRDRGRAQGLDLYQHRCPMDERDAEGTRGCRFCLVDEQR